MGQRFSEVGLRLGADPIWLLDLTLGGVAYRFASETVNITDGSSSLLYSGTLTDVDYSSTLEFISPDFEMPSANVAVTFKDDLAHRIAQGLDFGAATAQLALWMDGDEYDQRQVVLEGSIDVPSYGAIGEPVTFTIEANWLRNIRSMPDVTEVIEEVEWPQADSNAIGNAYPILIGAPGRQTFAGTPIYIVDDGSVSGTVLGLVAGHPCTAAMVSIFRFRTNGATSINYQKDLNLAEDANGNPYSYVDLTGTYTDGDSMFCMFRDGGGGLVMPGGGLINPYSTGLDEDGVSIPAYLTGAGDLIRYLLHQSGAKVDDGRCAAAAPYLNYVQIEGYIAERTDILEFLKSEIMPLLPCSLMTSANGIYPVVWRYDAVQEDAVAKLTANRDVFRSGLIDYVSNDVANEITIRYRHNARYNRLQKAVTVTGDVTKPTGGSLWRSDYCVTSRTRYGTRSLDIETEYITSRASAGRVINWMARAMCGRHRIGTYTAPHTLGWLEVGDIIALSDADLSFIDQLVIIRSIAWGETDLTFEFMIVADLPRDTIATG